MSEIGRNVNNTSHNPTTSIDTTISSSQLKESINTPAKIDKGDVIMGMDKGVVIGDESNPVISHDHAHRMTHENEKTRGSCV